MLVVQLVDFHMHSVRDSTWFYADDLYFLGLAVPSPESYSLLWYRQDRRILIEVPNFHQNF